MFPFFKEDLHLNVKGAGIWLVVFVISLCDILHVASYDITQLVKNISNNNCATSATGTCGGGNSGINTYHVTNMGTYKAINASFVQNYGTKSLIFGNSTWSAKSDSNIWFGNVGWTGYIAGYFDVGNILLTGVLGFGNSWQTCGGANITITSANGYQFSGSALTIGIAKSGTQNSWYNLRGTDILINNGSRIQINNGGGVRINDNADDINGKVNIWDTGIRMKGVTLDVRPSDTRG